MASYTGPQPFDEAIDEWPAYQVRLEAFFEGHGVKEEKKKRALFVAALSTNTVGVIAGRCAPDKPVPAMAAVRIQSWALILSAYSYNIQHKDGKANVPADALSRIPVSSSTLAEESEDCDGCETPLACGETPALRLLGFQPRSRLDNAVVPLAPVERSPCQTDVTGFLQTGDPVWVRIFGQGEPWTPATIRETQGARMVTADGVTGEIVRRHLDQVKVRLPDSSLANSPVPCPTGIRPESNTGRPEPEDPPAAGTPASTDLRPLGATPTLRRSTRIRRPPERFSP
ncbi:uncharacterized protein LOC125947154 [Dermacentor silvarum]|uniref:uncharacterized protein LOC125947154 n=1 Tax=Dermacentor silvarum TaxID=543639 RepID=UPI00210156AA|nr:uncharacterized protein LOC125947154 [Dermacentor silvarum]